MNYENYELYTQDEKGKFVSNQQKQTITRADGVTYERKVKDSNYDKIMTIRISKKMYEQLEKVACDVNESIGNIIRDAIKDYLGE